jgi:ribosomal protein RSM22 (predicted rRNA methylase)
MFFKDHGVAFHGHFHFPIGLQDRVGHKKYLFAQQDTAARFGGSTKVHRVSAGVWNTLARVSQLDINQPQPRIPSSIPAGVSRLSNLFTRGDLETNAAYCEDPQLCASYLAYYVPVNLSKVQLLLDELQSVLPTDGGGEFRVLDLGSGPGTGALAMLDWCCTTSLLPLDALRVTVVDRSARALGLCTEVWQAYGDTCKILRLPPLQPLEHNLEHSFPPGLRMVGREGRYDLIIVQNLLSELYIGRPDAVDRRAAFVAMLLDRLAVNGSVMLIEPALRSTSRALHQVRDQLLAQGQCTIYSPCLHDAPCPALIKPSDWCHEERMWETPDWIAQVDREVGFIKDALKFSYAILRKDGKTLVPRNSGCHRVVSEMRVMKGEKRVWLCDDLGRPEVGRQDKERSVSNAAFDQWHRGAIVRVSEIVRKTKKCGPSAVGRILSSGVVEIVRPVQT